MGTVLNSDYGRGVTIKRIQGIGNGGNEVQLDEASEEEAVSKGFVAQPTYQEGLGPVNVTVVDPVKVQPMDWVLQIHGPNKATLPGPIYVEGIADSGSWTLTGFADGAAPVQIYSERSIGTPNEQILEKYGISVNIKQVPPPGTNKQGTKNGYITSGVTFTDPSQPWLWGVQDETDSSFANWLRAGSTARFGAPSLSNPCRFNDAQVGTTFIDPKAQFGSMIANFSPMKATWGPYGLAGYFYQGGTFATSSTQQGLPCGHHPAAYPLTLNEFKTLQDVDLVYTNDKSKWTKCAVIEIQEDSFLAQSRGRKFYPRKHKGWNLELNADGTPKYSETLEDEGMSWFPGYAVNPGTGERLNIVFGEDSYLATDNGGDMIWNPTAPKGPNGFNPYDFSIVFGGRHFVYVLGTKYDSDRAFVSMVKKANSSNTFLKQAYSVFQWVGLPMLNPDLKLLSLKDGLIPTPTRLRFRVDRPYMPFCSNRPQYGFRNSGNDA